MRSSFAVRALVAASALALVPTVAQAAVSHTSTVQENAADWTPQVVVTTSVANPRVDAIAADPAYSTAYAGGLFNRVSQGGTAVDRSNVFAFDRTSGAIRAGFSPTLDGVVRAVENAPDGGVYVGGDFKNVNGVLRPALVKLNASGGIDTAFKPALKGIVYDIESYNGHLVVAGNGGGGTADTSRKKLLSLNPNTGANDGWLDVAVAGEAWNTPGTINSWGVTSVYDVAIAGGRLAAVGNFATVNGQARSRFFMLNTTSGGASLSPWYYQSFATPCATDADRRIANLQGVDFSPNGQFVSVAATGQIPEQTSQVWHQGDGPQLDSTVCDGFGRFDVTQPSTAGAEWINYTGGDSVWRVQDTGHAIYATGHFQWVDNPDGFGSQCPAGDTCSQRYGIAAVDADLGTALPWNPPARTKLGAKALEATTQGLWVGSNAPKFGNETHRGLALAPR